VLHIVFTLEVMNLSAMTLDRGQKTILYRGYDFLLTPTVFEPHDGSFFMAEHLNVPRGAVVADIGTGCGLLAVLAAERAHFVLASDVDPACCALARTNLLMNGFADRSAVAQADLLEPFRRDTFDLIIANLPMFPTDPSAPDNPLARGTDGGPCGRRFLDPLLASAPLALRRGGSLLIQQFDFCDIEATLHIMQAQGLSVQVVAEAVVPLSVTGRARLAYLRSLPVKSLVKRGTEPIMVRRVVIRGKRP
jgi:release factor glutamine methyltransferase